MSLTENDIKKIADISVPLEETIKELVIPYIGPFKITNASILMLDGSKTEESYFLIHNSKENEEIPIDSIAIVIDCYGDLTIKNLEIAYGRIQKLKNIKKSDIEGPPEGDIAMTVCIVLSKNTDLPLELISEKMSSLNNTIPSYNWPDVVAVLSTGIINYSGHIPTKDSSGDFFLPTESDDINSPAPSMLVNQIIRGGGDRTINKVISLIIARLAIFQPGTNLPNYEDFLIDFPGYGVTNQTYQFNLANVLIPMTREQVFAAQLPRESFNIVSRKEKLGSVQFLEWQDGGVFIIRGAFPLDIFLVFLRIVVPSIDPSYLRFFRGSDTQVSYVLPMGLKEFFQTLHIFEQRSVNMRIERETSKILSQKLENEGTNSQYVARLFMGIMNTRNIVYYENSDREHFDKLYEPVLSNIRNARQTANDISDQWEEHKKKLTSGSIVHNYGRTVQITENVDRHLKRDLENFLNLTVRTIKNSMQYLIIYLGIDIGFLFQKEPAFHAGLKKLSKIDPILADYIYNVRKWSEPLIKIRNDLEHGTFSLPNVEYELNSSPISAKEPIIEDKPITVYTAEILDRVCCFVEEVTTHCLQQKIPKGLNITEIPITKRTPDAPERFILTIEPGGKTPWVLSAHNSKFENI